MHRPDISRLRKNRSIYLKLGFIFSLSFMLLAFNWTSDFYVPDENAIEMEEDNEITVKRTIHEKKKSPPPPVVAVTPEPIIEDFEMTTEPIPEKIEAAITKTKEAPITEIEPTPLPPAPAPMPEPIAKETIPELFMVVEEMPRFPGCEGEGLNKQERKYCAEKKMLEFIYNKIKYPEIARRNGIEGTAVIRFVIEKDGRITNLEIVRNPGGGLGKESLRVVKDMPNWIPGKQRNEPVRVRYNLPVKFEMKN